MHEKELYGWDLFNQCKYCTPTEDLTLNFWNRPYRNEIRVPGLSLSTASLLLFPEILIKVSMVQRLWAGSVGVASQPIRVRLSGQMTSVDQ